MSSISYKTSKTNKGKGKKNFNKKHNQSNNFNKKEKINKTIVKISHLPDNITIRELNELISPWGLIGDINFGKSINKTAYIDFFKNEEALYFVEALDRTPFDSHIINVEIIKK